MKKCGKRWLGILLAASLLMGCGSEPGTGTVEQMIPESSTAPSVAEDMGNTADADSTDDGQTVQGQDWDRKDDSSYEALQRFSYELMLENMNEVNPVLSPVSAYLAMGMIGMGAEGATKQEFVDVMGGNMPAVSEKLMSQYPQEQEGLTLTIANSVWVDQQLTPKQQWLSDMQEIFRGESYRGVLSGNDVLEQINSWCRENTRGLIPKMLNAPLDADTRLALLDAIYFKGDWVNPFEAMDTAERPFTREDGAEVQAETMSKSGVNLTYIHSDLGEGVVLPYQGDEFAYVAILPPEGTDVRELYRQLTPEALAELLESKNTEFCNLRLPKYEISFDQKLNDSLIAMGLESAFDEDTADFSDLGDTEQGGSLYIGLVQQKAVFRVDEEGTEAAAVTMVVTNEACTIEVQEPRRLYFDRPFVYMILDQENQVPLFTGIMDDPTGELKTLPAQEAVQAESPADQAGAYESVQDFSYKLLKESLETENPVLSPASAYLALSMAASGAEGETKAELEALLGTAHEELSEKLLELAGEQKAVELILADSVWLDEDLEAVQAWLEKIEGKYQGEIYQEDLDTQKTMKKINDWAEEKTRGLVKEFLAEPLQEEAMLCLLNALYLEADWLSGFEGATRENIWYREDGTEKQVDTMHKSAAFDYVAGEGMDGVILPFQGEELVFLAIRPLEGQTARELYGQLTPEQLSGLIAGREEHLMNVALPRFTVSCDQKLNEVLERLGVKQAFEPLGADFSGICAEQPLYISLVRQKAVLELSEEGVKAGAVTEVEMRAGGAMPAEEPIEMTLDHPFVYMILDLESQVPLFVGILDDPSGNA